MRARDSDSDVDLAVGRPVAPEGLLVGQRPRRKRVARTRVPAPVPTQPDQRWTMDFVRDTTAEGRPFRFWTLVDDATRECPLLVVDRSLPAARVVEAVDALLLVRGRPPSWATTPTGRAPTGASAARARRGSGRAVLC